MEVIINMDNLQDIIEGAAKKNIETAITESIYRVAREKVDEIIKDSIEEKVNTEISNYIDYYLNNTKIVVGNTWIDKDVKEYSVEEYIKLQVASILENNVLVAKTKDRWGNYQENKVSFKEYIDSKLDTESIVKPYIDKLAKQVRNDVNSIIKNTFDEAMRVTLADNVFALVSASDTYKSISNSLKLLGE